MYPSISKHKYVVHINKAKQHRRSYIYVQKAWYASYCQNGKCQNVQKKLYGSV